MIDYPKTEAVMSIQKLPKRRFTRLQMVILAILLALLVSLATFIVIVVTYDTSDLDALRQQRIEAAGQTAVYEYQLTQAP